MVNGLAAGDDDWDWLTSNGSSAVYLWGAVGRLTRQLSAASSNADLWTGAWASNPNRDPTPATLDQVYLQAMPLDVSLPEPTLDTSIVVFDTTTGLSSDHSGQAFSAGIDYTIYIKVDSISEAVMMAPGERWTGGANLGEGDLFVLVGSGLPILGGQGGVAGAALTDNSYVNWGSTLVDTSWVAYVTTPGTIYRAFGVGDPFPRATSSTVLFAGSWVVNPNSGATLDQVSLTAMPGSVYMPPGSPDTSVVVFDLTSGLSSDHSSQTFNASVAYTIYLMVDSTDIAISMDEGEVWDGGANLNADDLFVLVGSGGEVIGRANGGVTTAVVGNGFVSWQAGGGTPWVAWISSTGNMSRAFDGASIGTQIFTGSWDLPPNAGVTRLSQAYLTTLPVSVSVPLIV